MAFFGAPFFWLTAHWHFSGIAFHFCVMLCTFFHQGVYGLYYIIPIEGGEGQQMP